MATERLELLKFIVSNAVALISPPNYPFGYMYCPAVQATGAKVLHDEGMIVAYPANAQPDGSFPVVPTEKGVNESKAPSALANVGGAQPAPFVQAGQAATSATSSIPTVIIEDGIPIPDRKAFGRGEGGPSKVDQYGFANMKIGQNFHLPASGDPEKPTHRAFSSVVSQANKKLHPMNFVVREVGADDPRGEGARVFRVDDMQGERPTRTRKPKEAPPVQQQGGFQGQGQAFAPQAGFDPNSGGFGFQGQPQGGGQGGFDPGQGQGFGGGQPEGFGGGGFAPPGGFQPG